MLKRLSALAAILAVAVVAMGVLAPAASAEDGETQDGGRRGTVLHGRGVLDARGSGLVALRGAMDLDATADKGVLLVKDIAGDATVEVDGTGGMTQWNGFDVYFGVDGEAHIKGSHVAVIILAEDLRLHVVGKGWAFLKGRGTYEVNNRGPFPWTPDGAFAGMGDPE